MKAIITLSLLLVGCNTSSDTLSKAEESLTSLKVQAKELADSLSLKSKKVTESASQEMNKLFSIEYRVVDLLSTLSGEEIQKELNRLGSERWSCGTPQLLASQNPAPEKLRFFCNRPSPTYLRYLKSVI